MHGSAPKARGGRPSAAWIFYDRPQRRGGFETVLVNPALRVGAEIFEKAVPFTDRIVVFRIV